MRRITHPSHVLAFLGFFAAVMAAGLIVKDVLLRASVQDVRAAVQQGPTLDAEEARHLALEGTRLPNWTSGDWTLAGGRSDLLEDGRDAITGFYRRGKETVALTVVDGGGLDDNEPTQTISTYDSGGETALKLGGVTGGLSPTQAGYTGRQVAIRSGLDCADGCVGPPPRPVISIRRDLGGQAIVLTAWPVTDRVFREAGALALRLED